jgi:hypothetical protein
LRAVPAVDLVHQQDGARAVHPAPLLGLAYLNCHISCPLCWQILPDTDYAYELTAWFKLD